ncbi:MAG: hypothetical protein IPN96_15175 [Anaerolineales bacterium]|nr:hypothetical protein [Anaerolineales bacterium]
MWDANLRIVTHLYAGYALELLEHLQGNDTWETNGLVIGSPIFPTLHQQRRQTVTKDGRSSDTGKSNGTSSRKRR